MSWFNWVLDNWLPCALVGLAFICVVLAGLTSNRRIKRRLLYSLVLELAASSVLLLLPAPPQEATDPYNTIRVICKLLGVVALLNALVAVSLNPFRGEGVSERWPAIVQDAIIIGGFLIFGFIWAEQQFVAIGLASSLIVGFALRDTLGNLFSGLALQSEKPFRVGDWVRVAQREGRVEGRVLEATWRATKIRTKSGNFIIVPNSVISQDSITNYSQPSPVMRLERRISMPYSVPPNQFKKVVVEAARDIPEILNKPGPDVLTNEYGDYYIRYRCRYWIDDFGRSEPISDKFITLLYYRLQRAGLPMPYPVRDVRITERTGEAPAIVDPRGAFVEKVDLFAGLDEEVKGKIAQSMQRITLAAGEPIISQGEEGDSMFFIFLGKVRILLEQDGTVQEVAVLESGDFFGEMALLTGEARAASAQAVGDVEAFVLGKEEFREILVEHPEVANQISGVISRRKEVLEEASAELEAHKVSRHEVQRSFLGRIQSFFGLT